MFLTGKISAARGAGDDFWYSPIGTVGGTVAGASVNADTAIRLSTVYKCIRIRAETIGMLPLQVYRRLPGGGKEADDSHPLAKLLHDRPNPWQTSMQWRQMMQAHLDLRGNAYSRIVYKGNRVEMLVPMHPDRVTVEVMSTGNPRFVYRESDGRERKLVFGEVLHLAGLSVDGYLGMNPIEAEREAIGAAMASRDYGAAFFKNHARAPTWVKFPGKFGSDDQRRAFSTKFSQAFGSLNSGKTPVLEQGMELHALPISNVDAQFIEARKMQDIDIAGLFRMPPHKLGILDRATWGNIEHQQLDFVTDAILPSCVAWEQALLRDLEFGDGFFAEFKVAMLLRGDTKTRYEAFGRAILDGWMTRNEARSMENLNPLPGLDRPLMPLNTAPVDEDGNVQAPEDPEPAGADDTTP
jgi:HK97 family phage portal protein